MNGTSVRRIVITGGPGSGKTTLIKRLESRGHKVFHEVSREITKRARQEGVDQLFLKDPLLFSLELLAARTQQFTQVSSWEDKTVYYDRGLPDIPSYLDYLGSAYPSEFYEACLAHRYHTIFLLPPWEAIYHQDEERYESFETAKAIYGYLRNGYRKFGYAVHELPTGEVDKRIDRLMDIVGRL